MTFKEFVEKQHWIFAKTYTAFAPHEYIIRGKNGITDKDFIEAAQYILDHGIRMYYYKHERKYLLFEDHFYWLMSEEITDKTVVINRCKPDDYDIVFMKRGTQRKAIEKEQTEKKKYEQYKFVFGGFEDKKD